MARQQTTAGGTNGKRGTSSARSGAAKRSKSGHPTNFVPLRVPPSVQAAQEAVGECTPMPALTPTIDRQQHVPTPAPTTAQAFNAGSVSPSSSVSLAGRSAASATTMGAIVEMMGTINQETEQDLMDACSSRIKRKFWKIDKFPHFNKCGSVSEAKFVQYFKTTVFQNYSDKFFDAMLPQIKKKATETLRFRRSAATLEMKENIFGTSSSPLSLRECLPAVLANTAIQSYWLRTMELSFTPVPISFVLTLFAKEKTRTYSSD